MTVTNEAVQQFQELWPIILPDVEKPPQQQIARWLVRDGSGGLRRALIALSERQDRRRARGDSPMSGVHCFKWISSFLNHRREMLWRTSLATYDRTASGHAAPGSSSDSSTVSGSSSSCGKDHHDNH